MASGGVAALDAGGVERAHVLGLSMGGLIVQTLAIEHPARLLTMTSMMSTTGDRDVGTPVPDALALLMSPPPVGRDDYLDRQVASILTWGSPGCIDEARIRSLAGEAYYCSF